MKTSVKHINVQSIIASYDRCCGCGVCAAICPIDCIEMKFDENLEYKPFVNNNACNNCELCIRVCPDNQETNIETEKAFKESNTYTITSDFLGNFLGCYVGYATKLEDRRASASGGVLTAILEELMAKKDIDAVVLVAPSPYKQTGKFFEAKITDEIKNIRGNRGSKYYPIEYSKIIKKIKSDNRRYAIVALPCVTLAIRKAQLYDKKLKANIRYLFSLVCGHGVSAAYTGYLLKTMGIKLSAVTKISYRDKTEISRADDFNFMVQYIDGNRIKVKRLGFISSDVGRIWTNHLFTLNKCLYCTDFAGELSDASFADAWLPEYKTEVNGTSIAIVRHTRIDSLIQEMIKKKKLDLAPISTEKIMKAQWGALQFKKELIKGRIRLKKLLRENFQDYGVDWHKTSKVEVIRKNWRILSTTRLSKLLYRKGLFSMLSTVAFSRMVYFVALPYIILTIYLQLVHAFLKKYNEFTRTH